VTRSQPVTRSSTSTVARSFRGAQSTLSRASSRGQVGGGSPVHVVADAAAFGLVEIDPEALRFATSESDRDLPLLLLDADLAVARHANDPQLVAAPALSPERGRVLRAHDQPRSLGALR
jgi:hypothetical protein